MSAVWSTDTAVDAAIQADPTLSAKLKGEKVYNGVAPAGALCPYILLGQAVETSRRTFGRKGYDGILTIDAWSSDLTKQEAAALYGDLERLFDGTTIALSGLHFVGGILELIAITLDPSGKYTHATSHYMVTSFG